MNKIIRLFILSVSTSAFLCSVAAVANSGESTSNLDLINGATDSFVIIDCVRTPEIVECKGLTRVRGYMGPGNVWIELGRHGVPRKAGWQRHEKHHDDGHKHGDHHHTRHGSGHKSIGHKGSGKH